VKSQPKDGHTNGAKYLLKAINSDYISTIKDFLKDFGGNTNELIRTFNSSNGDDYTSANIFGQDTIQGLTQQFDKLEFPLA
jgi:hypothetical protein